MCGNQQQNDNEGQARILGDTGKGKIHKIISHGKFIHSLDWVVVQIRNPNIAGITNSNNMAQKHTKKFCSLHLLDLVLASTQSYDWCRQAG